MPDEIAKVRPLRRDEACDYLYREHAIVRKPSTLAKLATIGGGPQFRLIGRIPVYEPADLDAYAAAITSPKVSSSSELRPRRASASDAPRAA